MRGIAKYLLPAVFLLLFMGACSTQRHFHVLSFFFDGVQDPALAKADSAEFPVIQSNTDTLTLADQKTGNIRYYHEPFRRKECASCHNTGNLGIMNEPQPELCFGCHINYETRFSYKHGPSSGGYCSECHHPHESELNHLLLQQGNALCMNCHDSTWLAGSIYHQISEEEDCEACHNPHGSNNHSILLPGTCFRCHGDYAEEFDVLHGPVASGFCSSCHIPHRNGEGYLLKKTGNDLCLYCHETARLLDGETHSGMEGMLCTECHHPHGGSERYLFK